MRDWQKDTESFVNCQPNEWRRLQVPLAQFDDRWRAKSGATMPDSESNEACTRSQPIVPVESSRNRTQ